MEAYLHQKVIKRSKHGLQCRVWMESGFVQIFGQRFSV